MSYLLYILSLVVLGLGLLNRKSIRELQTQINNIMAKQSELVADLELVQQQQTKVQAEIRGVQTESDNLKKRVAELEAIVNNGGDASPELVAAVKAVKDQAQALDEQIPDVPPVTPA